MIDEKMKRFFECNPDTPPYNVIGDYRCSVHYNNTYRLAKAREQAIFSTVDTEIIISYVNEFFEAIGMNTIESPKIHNPQQIDYKKIKKDNVLADERDIVWMKFTTKGYLGVVAKSNDINFDIPLNVSDYDKKEWRYNSYLKKQELVWKHTSSGILVHQLGQEWDTSFVLMFPLVNIPDGYDSGDIETAIGNYLISKEVPIIDFYSHNY